MSKLDLLLLSFSFLLSSTTSSSLSSSSSPALRPGPILTNGRNYTHVCHPLRFASLGLDIHRFRYCDKSLAYADRVADLIGRMTLEEKVAQTGDKAVGVDRIGLPKYNWWSEALHGVSNVGHGTYFGDIVPGATSFPTVILIASSFNESLWTKIGQTVSSEARAMYNLGHAGLTFWSPNINVVRDPRWGRVLETPGEDPLVAGTFAKDYVRGLQDVEGQEIGSDPNSRPLKVSSCCKHYAAYDVDNWRGVDRYHFDAKVTEQDMVETFLRPFEMCVKEGDVSSVMCSYNRVNGIPVCVDTNLLSNTIRGDWNLHGYIVSDCDSLEVMFDYQKWLNDTKEDTVAQALKAGMDLDCGDYYPKYTGSAIAQGKVRESKVDEALGNLYTVLMRLGFFDGSDLYNTLGTKDICTNQNVDLAADAARQGIVLLKNSNNTLPLINTEDQIKKIAIVGPHANATKVMIGNYEGVPCRYISPLEAFKGEVNDVNYQLGCDVACKNDSLFHPAINAVKNADASVIIVGLDLNVEAESLDRTDLLLPGHQTQLINQVAEAANGPVVLIIFSAGCIDISFAIDNPKIGAILWAGYPGAEGGRAIADVVFGRYNPGGRLPVTWYKADYVTKLPMTSMKLRPDDELGYPGRTYKFFDGAAVFPFGYGLSYTTFTYHIRPSANLLTVKIRPSQFCKPVNYNAGSFAPPCPSVLTDQLPCADTVTVRVKVANTGEVNGSHVVMVYTKPPAGIAGAPAKQLVGFQRVFVPAGKSTLALFRLNVCKAFSIVEKTAYTVLPSGQHEVFVGDGVNAVSFQYQINLIY